MFWKNKRSKYVEYDYFRLRENQWEEFIKTCETFDSVKIKNGKAVGYNKGEGKAIYSGTLLLIPFLCVYPYTEL